MEPSRPSAADLGVSDIEYERIRRDMQRRGLAEAPPPPLPTRSGPPGRSAPGATRRRSPKRRLAVLAALVLAIVAIRLGTSDPGPSYTFMVTVHGQPVTYSSCRPIQVSVYPAGGPPNAEALVREAVDQVRAATGLDIVVSGAFGGYAPNWNFADGPVEPDDPISVSWQDGNSIARLTGDVVGLGGSRVLTMPNGSKRLVAGTVALSRQFYATLAEHHDHGKELQVLLHELGHVVGLDHVKSRHEIMYRSVTGLTAYGPGDLQGLSRLGNGPCV